MKIVNCKRCGKIFQMRARDICVECINEEEEILQTIRSYLKQNPLSSLAEVSAATEVPVEDITDLIHAGTLRLGDFPNMTVECQGCGASIQQGRYCPNCNAALGMKLTGAANTLKPSTQGKEGQHRGFYSRESK